MKKNKVYLKSKIKSIILIYALFFSVNFLTACSVNKDYSSSADILFSSEDTEARKRARIRLELASNYFESEQIVIALDETKQALTTDPSYADAYNMLGLIYMRLSDYDKAEESFRRALALQPRDSNIAHNYAWLLCLQKKYIEADNYFNLVFSNNNYSAVSKTLMTQGICQISSGEYLKAEKTLLRSYEIDISNPITSYNLANLFFRKNDFSRAQFYIRRLNNSEMANAETLWLGLKIERKLNDGVAMRQLADQLRKRFPGSSELSLYDSGKFND